MKDRRKRTKRRKERKRGTEKWRGEIGKEGV